MIGQFFFYVLTGMSAILGGYHFFSDAYDAEGKIYQRFFLVTYCIVQVLVVYLVFIAGIDGAIMGMTGKALFCGAASCALSVIAMERMTFHGM